MGYIRSSDFHERGIFFLMSVKVSWKIIVGWHMLNTDGVGKKEPSPSWIGSAQCMRRVKSEHCNCVIEIKSQRLVLPHVWTDVAASAGSNGHITLPFKPRPLIAFIYTRRTFYMKKHLLDLLSCFLYFSLTLDYSHFIFPESQWRPHHRQQEESPGHRLRLLSTIFPFHVSHLN